jgi:hypothetical protein
MIALTAGDAALDRLEGMVNSFVRGPRGSKRGARISHVYGQFESAKRYGVSEEAIRARILKGMTNPPKAAADRVEEIKRRFLK